MQRVLVGGFAGGQITGAQASRPGQFLVDDNADTQAWQSFVLETCSSSFSISARMSLRDRQDVMF
ncbi:MAG: hypothetical protein Ct9H300mP1_02220 [Planctomycetaceae bacterium]|nr:MAG: hypothetical protein Ct9H300mP1_02220 [Planctomycetaceae bacterium]